MRARKAVKKRKALHAKNTRYNDILDLLFSPLALKMFFMRFHTAIHQLVFFKKREKLWVNKVKRDTKNVRKKYFKLWEVRHLYICPAAGPSSNCCVSLCCSQLKD